MKNILLVEDDDLLREIIAESLRISSADCVVHAVSDGAHAMEQLGRQTFDLLITDLCLPEVDGLAVLSFLRERGINTPSIVITGQSTAGLETLVRSLGARVFFHKPFDLDVLLVTADRFLLAATDRADDEAPAFTLPSFLQLMEIDGKTGAVRVTSTENREGWFAFQNGKLVSAMTLGCTGEDAALKILGWPAPEIRVFNKVELLVPNMHTGLTSLLLRSSQCQDELLSTDTQPISFGRG